MDNEHGMNLNREQVRFALTKIPKDHELVLASIAELGEQDLEALRLIYVHTRPFKRLEFIDGLKEMIAEIQSGVLTGEEENG